MLKLIQTSSLVNILPRVEGNYKELNSLTLLSGERGSFQYAYRSDNDNYVSVSLESEIKDHIKIYKIGYAPVLRSTFSYAGLGDTNYLSHDGCMFPDPLYEYKDTDEIRSPFYYGGFFVEIDNAVPAGEYTIKFTLSKEKPVESCSAVMKLKVLEAKLPAPHINYYNIIHLDCIATHYGMEVFSEAHWEMIERFVEMSARYGNVQTLLPLFTPPLDTYVGGERPTVQLVGVTKKGDEYSFNFDKLDRYIALCQKYGIVNFVTAQLVTQWGAAFTPKIIVNEDGVDKKLFGWHVKSTDQAFHAFLRQFLPAVVEHFKEIKVDKNIIFTISDEPGNEETMERYRIICNLMKPYIEGFEVMDAMSSYEHYSTSGATIPLTSTTSYPRFKDNCDNLWVYYCCSQDRAVSNRFINMPSYRNRSIGYQLYAAGVAGFHHWAFNYYYAREAKRVINPFYETDSDGGFPGGDGFIVYPGKEGPIPSIRLIVFNEALQDLRALKLLEGYIGKQEVLALLQSTVGNTDFLSCATSEDQILAMREKITEALEKHCG